MLDFEQLGLSLLLVVLCATVAWLAPRLASRWVAVGLVVAIGIGVTGVLAAAPLYPWSDLLVLVIALAAGILLGRGVPVRFRPWLILLAVLSALDIAQIALTGGLVTLQPLLHPGTSAPPSGPLLLGNFYLLVPGGHYLVGIFDLLIITALAEYWRRRDAVRLPFVFALQPGILGFVLGYAAVWLTQRGGWPLIPFFTLGWLISEGIYHLVAPSAPISIKSVQ